MEIFHINESYFYISALSKHSYFFCLCFFYIHVIIAVFYKCLLPSYLCSRILRFYFCYYLCTPCLSASFWASVSPAIVNYLLLIPVFVLLLLIFCETVTAHFWWCLKAAIQITVAQHRDNSSLLDERTLWRLCTWVTKTFLTTFDANMEVHENCLVHKSYRIGSDFVRIISRQYSQAKCTMKELTERREPWWVLV